jgi:hypothetical protein
LTKEEIRLAESGTRKKHWKRWGPYLSERAWGTVREDYSLQGNAWEYLPHDHARNADVISMPDKWEYPWYAAWDLAFHWIPLAPLAAINKALQAN